MFGTQYSPAITLNWKVTTIYRKRVISGTVRWTVVKNKQWMWVADGQFAITTNAAGEPDGNFYVLFYEDETHKNYINDPATDVHQITIENTVGDNISIATIDGQEGQINCYSYLRDYPLSIRALAYRDELSAYALSSQIPYEIYAVPSSTLLLKDRACNTFSPIQDTTFVIPTLPSIYGKCMDFLLCLTIGIVKVPDISFTKNGAARMRWAYEGDTFPKPDSEGLWLYSFTQIEELTIAVSLKKLNVAPF